jgi:hypothetical protein
MDLGIPFIVSLPPIGLLLLVPSELVYPQSDHFRRLAFTMASRAFITLHSLHYIHNIAFIAFGQKIVYFVFKSLRPIKSQKKILQKNLRSKKFFKKILISSLLLLLFVFFNFNFYFSVFSFSFIFIFVLKKKII